MSFEYIVEREIATKDEAGEKKKGKEILEPNNRGRFPKYNPNDKDPGDGNEATWCEKCRWKHFGQCSEAVTWENLVTLLTSL